MGNERVSKLRTVLQEQGLDAMLITSGINRRYLSGFTYFFRLCTGDL